MLGLTSALWLRASWPDLEQLRVQIIIPIRDGVRPRFMPACRSIGSVNPPHTTVVKMTMDQSCGLVTRVLVRPPGNFARQRERDGPA